MLRAFGVQEPARTVLRQYQEIKVGDVLLDMAPAGLVELLPAQPISGVVRLRDISHKGVRFQWGGQLYAQAEIGEALASAWDAIVQNQRLSRTLLLRRAT